MRSSRSSLVSKCIKKDVKQKENQLLDLMQIPSVRLWAPGACGHMDVFLERFHRLLCIYRYIDIE